MVGYEERVHQNLWHYHPKELSEAPYHFERKYKTNLINKLDNGKVICI
jgi:hypothetical protein